ncbi:MAG: hypothetical protein ACI9ZV_000986 [Candidatus Azotimanducaceae bacterium]|jgi:hypothetical protein
MFTSQPEGMIAKIVMNPQDSSVSPLLLMWGLPLRPKADYLKAVGYELKD